MPAVALALPHARRCQHVTRPQSRVSSIIHSVLTPSCQVPTLPCLRPCQSLPDQNFIASHPGTPRPPDRLQLLLSCSSNPSPRRHGFRDDPREVRYPCHSLLIVFQRLPVTCGTEFFTMACGFWFYLALAASSHHAPEMAGSATWGSLRGHLALPVCASALAF